MICGWYPKSLVTMPHVLRGKAVLNSHLQKEELKDFIIDNLSLRISLYIDICHFQMSKPMFVNFLGCVLKMSGIYFEVL